MGKKLCKKPKIKHIKNSSDKFSQHQFRQILNMMQGFELETKLEGQNNAFV